MAFNADTHVIIRIRKEHSVPNHEEKLWIILRKTPEIIINTLNLLNKYCPIMDTE